MPLIRRSTRGAVLLAALAALWAPACVRAQPVRTAAGALAGAAGGAWLSVSFVTAATRAGHYLFSPEQAVVRLIPVPAGMVAGALLGHQGGNVLDQAVLGSLAGVAVGGGVGALLGRTFWEGPEGIWAGAVIGSGVGLLAGSVWGAIRGSGDPDEPDVVLSFSLPVGR